MYILYFISLYCGRLLQNYFKSDLIKIPSKEYKRIHEKKKKKSMKRIKTTLKKVHWNDVDFSPIKITSKKVHRKNGDFRPIDITSKKVRRNDMDISQIKITSKSYVKISSSFCSLISCGTKYVETTWFFPIEITLKKYVEATWKYDDIFFSTYRRNIDIEWMLITRVALVGFAEIFVCLMYFVGTNEKVQHEKIATWKTVT